MTRSNRLFVGFALLLASYLSFAAGDAKATTACTTACATSYAPSKFSSLLTSTYSPGSLTAVTTLSTRSRYLFQDVTTSKYLDLGTLSTATDRYPLVEMAFTSSPTYQEYLTKLVQVVQDASGSCFRFDSHLNSSYSLDVGTSAASATLTFSNNWGLIASGSTSPGYTCFSYNTSTKLLTAVKRYPYVGTTTGTSPAVTSYTHSSSATLGSSTYYLKYTAGTGSSAGTFSLVTTTAAATQFKVYANPFGTGMDVPTAFNPATISYGSNSAVTASTSFLKISTAGFSAYNTMTATQIKSAYKSQLYDSNTIAIGTNANTRIAAQAMLDTISTTLQSEGSSLRYPKNVYMVFRDAALSYIQKSGDVIDGSVGQNTVPFVWFSNEMDSSNKHHPFMNISSYSVPDGPMGLLDVPTPPGSGVCASGSGSCGYGQQTVTRSSALQNYLFRVPLRDYGLVTTLTQNTMGTTGAKSLLSDSGLTGTNTFENYASISENGVLINGVSAYPILSNTLQSCAAGASRTAQGCHVGQGLGLHCHSDGFQANSATKMNLYTASDYTNKDHPPLIGFGFDGVAIFGAYVSTSTSMAGYSPAACNASPAAATSTTPTACPSTPISYKTYALDAWGGHTHSIDGTSVYHYHAHAYTSTVVNTTKSYSDYAYITGAWKGQINSIPNFWDNSGKPTTGKTTYSGMN